jgi:hypothetical protein
VSAEKFRYDADRLNFQEVDKFLVRAVILNKALLIYYNMVIFAGECAFLICYVIHRPEMARRMDKLA